MRAQPLARAARPDGDLAGVAAPGARTERWRAAWNHLGTRLIARLRTGESVRISVDIRAVFPARAADRVTAELRQTLDELGLGGMIAVD